MRVEKDIFLKHIKEIAEIEKQSFTDPWTEEMFYELIESSFYITYFIITDGKGKLVSYLIMAIVEYEAEIYNVAVSPDCRKKGLGSEILDEAVCFARQSDVGNIYLEVRESNLSAISLYLRKNFSIEGKRRNYYSSPKENALVMKLSLEIK